MASVATSMTVLVGVVASMSLAALVAAIRLMIAARTIQDKGAHDKATMEAFAVIVTAVFGGIVAVIVAFFMSTSTPPWWGFGLALVAGVWVGDRRAHRWATADR